MINTLEDFLELECGMITPALLEAMEPHREFVEDSLANFNQFSDDSGWHIFSDMLWKYLPEPKL